MERCTLAPESFLDLYQGWLTSDDLFPRVMSETPWEHKAIKMYGKDVMQPRLTAWYGSNPYTYSGTRNAPTKPTDTLARHIRLLRKVAH